MFRWLFLLNIKVLEDDLHPWLRPKASNCIWSWYFTPDCTWCHQVIPAGLKTILCPLVAAWDLLHLFIFIFLFWSEQVPSDSVPLLQLKSIAVAFVTTCGHHLVPAFALSRGHPSIERPCRVLAFLRFVLSRPSWEDSCSGFCGAKIEMDNVRRRSKGAHWKGCN